MGWIRGNVCSMRWILQGRNRAAITPYLLNAAKALIPKQWGSKNAPTMKEWLREVDKIRLMEKVIHLQNDFELRFASIWKG